MPNVLLIDDNPAVTEALALLLSLHDVRARTAASPDEGLGLLADEPVDLVIQDMNFAADTTSGEEGVALFHAIRASYPDLPVVLLTAWTHLEAAVELVKAGAADYLAKPWDDTKLVTTVKNLLALSASSREVTRTRRERDQRRARLARDYDLGGLVFASDAMTRTLELACRVARAEVPVLITGPNGSGKEGVADVVHRNSAVRNGPFMALNCGALPADLLEAELFGAEAGAYTGAKKARVGRFEAADGGTLFLDEIGNLSPAGQMKLLRVIETGQFQRLGSSRTRSAKVRVVSATNADLPAMIEAGRFREDLYYRLNVIEVAVPALAERADDVLVLAEHFLGDAELSEAAREALVAHDWPGNVRELKNAIERARLLAGGEPIAPELLHLPTQSRAAAPRDLDDPSREAVERALSEAGGVVAHGAKALGLSRQSLYRRMQHYGIAG